MPLRVSGKNFDIGEALRQRVSERISGALEKYFDGGWSGHVTVCRDGSGYRSDCALHLDSGLVIQAHGNAQDPYSSADSAVERIETRLRRHKDRFRHRAAKSGNGAIEVGETAALTVFSAPDDEAEEAVLDGWSPTVVAEQTTSLPSLAVSDAVLELDLTGMSVLVFRHAGHGRINVVYRRSDGHVGWVDPPARLPADDIH